MFFVVVAVAVSADLSRIFGENAPSVALRLAKHGTAQRMPLVVDEDGSSAATLHEQIGCRMFGPQRRAERAPDRCPEGPPACGAPPFRRVSAARTNHAVLQRNSIKGCECVVCGSHRGTPRAELPLKSMVCEQYWPVIAAELHDGGAAGDILDERVPA